MYKLWFYKQYKTITSASLHKSINLKTRTIFENSSSTFGFWNILPQKQNNWHFQNNLRNVFSITVQKLVSVNSYRVTKSDYILRHFCVADILKILWSVRMINRGSFWPQIAGKLAPSPTTIAKFPIYNLILMLG